VITQSGIILTTLKNCIEILAHCVTQLWLRYTLVRVNSKFHGILVCSVLCTWQETGKVHIYILVFHSWQPAYLRMHSLQNRCPSLHAAMSSAITSLSKQHWHSSSSPFAFAYTETKADMSTLPFLPTSTLH